MAKIVVVGAGVTGLTSAYLLLERGHDVTIISKKFYFDGYEDPCYTSNFAGANWHSFANDDEYELQEFDKPGYLKFMRLAETEPRAGIWQKLNVCEIEKEVFLTQYNNDPSKVPLPWFKNFVKGFRILPKEELPPNIGFAYEFLGVVISVNIYLSYLLSKCVEDGVSYKRVNLKHIKDASKYHSSGSALDVIVNCTGLLASKLGGVEDPLVHPIKGQLVVVENNIDAVRMVEFNDPQFPQDKLYVMPRKEGGSIIGGCMLADNWDPQYDHAMGNRTLARAAKYLPGFLDPKLGNPPEFKVIRYQVGFRPGRTGGPRIEISDKNIVHNYGIGGAGFQSSYGTSSKVVKLVESIVTRAKL